MHTLLYVEIPPLPQTWPTGFPASTVTDPDENTTAPSELTSLPPLDTNSSQEAQERSIGVERIVINERCFEYCAMLGPVFYVTSRTPDLTVTSPFDWSLSGTEVEIRFSASIEQEADEVNMDDG